MDKAYYKSQLLEHYKNPVGSGEVPSDYAQGSGANPLCGDEICVGVKVENNEITDVRFEARACSICVASASMMTTLLQHQPVKKAAELKSQLEQLLNGELGLEAMPDVMHPLSAIVPMRSRHKCTLIGWEALDEALGK